MAGATIRKAGQPVPQLTPHQDTAPRIEDYALLGDLQTGVLVHRNGSIDWCCFPRFDSAACFAAILGGPEHGRWLVAPASEIISSTRCYRADTLVLDTLHETADGLVRVIDFMPPRGRAPDIVRIVEGVRGTVAMQSELVVRFNYGSVVPWVRRVDHARAGRGRTRRAVPAHSGGGAWRRISRRSPNSR